MSRKSKLSSILSVLRARVASDEGGATAIEYALIAAGVGAAVATTVWNLGSTTRNFYASLAAMF